MVFLKCSVVKSIVFFDLFYISVVIKCLSKLLQFYYFVLVITSFYLYVLISYLVCRYYAATTPFL